MEPVIQYATTADGVAIAFWALGSGPPVVHMTAFPWSHIQLEWQDPDFRRWYERLGRGRLLVRFDSRGCGLSDRDAGAYSLDGLVLDLEAVADRLALDRFAVVGVCTSAPVAVAYAVRHPERVSALYLWCPIVQPREFGEQADAISSLRDRDWDLFTETVAHAIVAGWQESERARRFAVLMRQATSLEGLEAAEGALREVDIEGLLPAVSAPTLVMHRRHAAAPDVQTVRRLAAQIPNARLALLEGASLLPYVGDMEAAARAVDDFSGAKPPASVAPSAAAGQGRDIDYTFRTILFSDIEGSTLLTQKLGDAGVREVLRDHEQTVREALRAHGGSEIKAMGDGFMASFPSASRALECAVAIQKAARDQNERHPEAALRVRVGLNAGEPIAEEGDLFGTAVILAARIADLARGGEVLVSNVVRELVAGKGFLFADRGAVPLRGFEDPVRVYEVRWGD